MPLNPATTMTGRPRAMTVVRVLVLLAGAVAVVTGLLEQNSIYRPGVHVVGWLVAGAGVACWPVVFLLRRAGERRWALALVAMALLAGLSLAQFALLGVPAVLSGLMVPALALWPLTRPTVRTWLRHGAPPREIAPTNTKGRRGGWRRIVAPVGAVSLATTVLVALIAAGATAALWPCSLPESTVNGLDLTQSPPQNHALRPTGSLTTSDGTRLAYYADIPASPIASLVFYHGSGANGLSYLPLAHDLADRYRVASYLIDIRGHGASEGPRGDTPTVQQVWDDVRTAVAFVHGAHPEIPEFVGGHSAGAGVVLNSVSRIDDLVAGYVFLAPDFGLHSDTMRVSRGSNFATVCRRPFIVNALSNGVLDQHTRSLAFAYSPEQIRSANLVARYTVNMALAQNAAHSSADLRAIARPLGVWIGAQDEVFNPARVLDYARQTRGPASMSIVSGVNHLGIINHGADAIGPWISTFTRARGPHASRNDRK
jgi:alpha-beta hydrolase superfamily lysophospholipase